MNNKVFRPGYRIMHVILNQCLRPNLGKAMFAVVFCNLLGYLLYFVSMIPAMLSMISAEVNMSSMILEGLLSVALFFAATVVMFFLKYGLNVTLCRMVEKTYVTLGYLFIGFRRNSKKVLKGALIFASIYAVIVILVLLCASFGSMKISVEDLSHDSLELIAAYIRKNYLIIIGLMFIVNLLFSFVWLVIYCEDGCGVFAAFGRSVKYLWGRLFHYIGFMFYAAGLDLVFLIALSLFSAFVPEVKGESQVSLFANVLSFASIILIFNITARMGIAKPLYYFFITNKIMIHRSDYRPGNKIVPNESYGAENNVATLSGSDVAMSDEPVSEDDAPSPEDENHEENKDE